MVSNFETSIFLELALNLHNFQLKAFKHALIFFAIVALGASEPMEESSKMEEYGNKPESYDHKQEYESHGYGNDNYGKPFIFFRAQANYSKPSQCCYWAFQSPGAALGCIVQR